MMRGREGASDGKGPSGSPLQPDAADTRAPVGGCHIRYFGRRSARRRRPVPMAAAEPYRERRL